MASGFEVKSNRKGLTELCFSRTFFSCLVRFFSCKFYKSLFPLYKKYNIWGTTQPFAPSRILLERSATGFVLVVSINGSGNTGGILHGVVVTPFVIFFLGNLTFTKLACLLMPGSEVVKKLRIGWVIELFETDADFSIDICNLETVNILQGKKGVYQ